MIQLRYFPPFRIAKDAWSFLQQPAAIVNEMQSANQWFCR